MWSMVEARAWGMDMSTYELRHAQDAAGAAKLLLASASPALGRSNSKKQNDSTQQRKTMRKTEFATMLNGGGPYVLFAFGDADQQQRARVSSERTECASTAVRAVCSLVYASLDASLWCLWWLVVCGPSEYSRLVRCRYLSREAVACLPCGFWDPFRVFSIRLVGSDFVAVRPSARSPLSLAVRSTAFPRGIRSWGHPAHRAQPQCRPKGKASTNSRYPLPLPPTRSCRSSPTRPMTRPRSAGMGITHISREC